jgi:hypothetical protein
MFINLNFSLQFFGSIVKISLFSKS